MVRDLLLYNTVEPGFGVDLMDHFEFATTRPKFRTIWVPSTVLNAGIFKGFTRTQPQGLHSDPHISSFQENVVVQWTNASMLSHVTTSTPWRLGKFLADGLDFCFDWSTSSWLVGFPQASNLAAMLIFDASIRAILPRIHLGDLDIHGCMKICPCLGVRFRCEDD